MPTFGEKPATTERFATNGTELTYDLQRRPVTRLYRVTSPIAMSTALAKTNAFTNYGEYAVTWNAVQRDENEMWPTGAANSTYLECKKAGYYLAHFQSSVPYLGELQWGMRFIKKETNGTAYAVGGDSGWLTRMGSQGDQTERTCMTLVELKVGDKFYVDWTAFSAFGATPSLNPVGYELDMGTKLTLTYMGPITPKAIGEAPANQKLSIDYVKVPTFRIYRTATTLYGVNGAHTPEYNAARWTTDANWTTTSTIATINTGGYWLIGSHIGPEYTNWGEFEHVLTVSGTYSVANNENITSFWPYKSVSTVWKIGAGGYVSMWHMGHRENYNLYGGTATYWGGQELWGVWLGNYE